MKIEFNSYPLDIFDAQSSKNLMNSIDAQIPKISLSKCSLGESILTSRISKAAGAGLLSLIDTLAIGIYGNKARKCLANLVESQTREINRGSIRLIEASQVNLMATSCVTDYLSSLESSSWGNGAKNIGKAIFGLFEGRNPLDTIWESVKEISDKYDDICQVYHIAFLLNAYKSSPSLVAEIKDLIIETLCNDSSNNSSFSSKNRPKLFYDRTHKTLNDNLSYNLDLIRLAPNYKDLYNPFVKEKNRD